MSDSNGSRDFLQVTREAMHSTNPMHSTPFEEFITNRVSPYFDVITEENMLEVLCDVYLAGIRDSSFTLADVADCAGVVKYA
jgi:hypothetical protein